VKQQGILYTIARLAGIILLVEAIILGIMGLIYWLAGWTTVEQYADGLMWVGLISIGISLMSVQGQWDSTRSFDFQYSASVIDQDRWKLVKSYLAEGLQVLGMMLVLLIIGMLNLGVWWLLS